MDGGMAGWRIDWFGLDRLDQIRFDDRSQIDRCKGRSVGKQIERQREGESDGPKPIHQQVAGAPLDITFMNPTYESNS